MAETKLSSMQNPSDDQKLPFVEGIFKDRKVEGGGGGCIVVKVSEKEPDSTVDRGQSPVGNCRVAANIQLLNFYKRYSEFSEFCFAATGRWDRTKH